VVRGKPYVFFTPPPFLLPPPPFYFLAPFLPPFLASPSWPLLSPPFSHPTTILSLLFLFQSPNVGAVLLIRPDCTWWLGVPTGKKPSAGVCVATAPRRHRGGRGSRQGGVREWRGNRHDRAEVIGEQDVMLTYDCRPSWWAWRECQFLGNAALVACGLPARNNDIRSDSIRIRNSTPGAGRLPERRARVPFKAANLRGIVESFARLRRKHYVDPVSASIAREAATITSRPRRRERNSRLSHGRQARSVAGHTGCRNSQACDR